MPRTPPETRQMWLYDDDWQKTGPDVPIMRRVAAQRLPDGEVTVIDRKPGSTGDYTFWLARDPGSGQMTGDEFGKAILRIRASQMSCRRTESFRRHGVLAGRRRQMVPLHPVSKGMYTGPGLHPLLSLLTLPPQTGRQRPGRQSSQYCRCVMVW